MNGNSTFTWFKLPTALITQPKFQRLSPIAQAGFMTLCCVYWQDSGVMTYEDAQMNAEGVDELIERGYIQAEDGMISVPFLDEQINEVEQMISKKKAAGVKSAEARAKQKPNNSSTPVQHVFNTCSTDKIREDKKEIREEEIDRKIERETRVNAVESDQDFFDEDSKAETEKEKVPPKRKRFEPPNEMQVQAFFQTTASPNSWSAFYNYYLANGWKVGKNPMKDWHAAARGWVARQNEFTKPQNNGRQQPNTADIARSVANDIINGDWDVTKG
jgi:hypothetical protein